LQDPASRELIIHDDEQECPYLPDRQARMPLRWQVVPVPPRVFDRALAAGDRRVGRMLYRTACDGCAACKPLRVAASSFSPSRSQRRVARRNADIRIEVGPVSFSERHLELFNRHRIERNLATDGRQMSEEEYVGWFAQSCTRTAEMRYLLDDRLVGVGILDIGDKDTSSVYYYFDPDEARRSLGTYSVLSEVAWLRSRRGRFHYLGLWVEGCRHLDYKATFSPHEKLLSGRWTACE